MSKAGTELELRVVICWILSKLRVPDSAPVLLSILDDENVELRLACIQALGEIGDKQAVLPIMRKLREDSATNVRILAAYALGMIGDDRAIQPLLRILNDINEPDKLRGQAAESLGEIGDAVAVDALVATLEDVSDEVRFWSVFALGKLGDVRAIPKLKTVAESDTGHVENLGSIREEARNAIKMILSRA